jgi:hypothetical protein
MPIRETLGSQCVPVRMFQRAGVAASRSTSHINRKTALFA